MRDLARGDMYMWPSLFWKAQNVYHRRRVSKLVFFAFNFQLNLVAFAALDICEVRAFSGLLSTGTLVAHKSHTPSYDPLAAFY